MAISQLANHCRDANNRGITTIVRHPAILLPASRLRGAIFRVHPATPDVRWACEWVPLACRANPKVGRTVQNPFFPHALILRMSVSDLPWPERFRPAVLADVAGNATVIASLQALVLAGVMQHHMLLSGPPGTGKTTAARCFATAMLGDNRTAVLSLNASDTR